MMVKNILKVIESNLSLFIRKIVGCRVSWKLVSLVSMKATIMTSGKNSKIILGKKCAIRSNTEVAATNATIILGDKVFVNKNCMIVSHEQITIGDNTSIGPNVCIYDHDHDGKGGYLTSPVFIGKNVWIGAGCVILKGVSIGDNAVIGAGTIITKNVNENLVVFQKSDRHEKMR